MSEDEVKVNVTFEHAVPPPCRMQKAMLDCIIASRRGSCRAWTHSIIGLGEWLLGRCW